MTAADVNSRMMRGASWMLLYKLLDRLLGLVSTIALARLLSPEDFGVVAMAMSVIVLIELASAFSFDLAIVQRANPSRDHYNTAWTLRLLFGMACGLSIMLLGIPASVFYEDPRLSSIMLVLGVAWIIESAENIGTVNFRRQLDFRREFVFITVKRIAGFIVTIACALAFKSYWALVIGAVTGRMTGVVLSYVMQSFRPRPCLKTWRELFSFSGWLFLTNLLGTLIQRLSHFVIGRFHGAGALGIYTIASDIAALASSEIMSPINRVLLPGLSRVAESQGNIGANVKTVTAAAMLITTPAALGIAAISEPLVLVLLGTKWTEAIPIIQVLAVAGAINCITSSSQPAYLAVGKSHIQTALWAVFVLALVPSLLVLGKSGLVGAAMAYLVANAIAVAYNLIVMRRHLGVGTHEILAVVWRPIVASTLMAALVHYLIGQGVLAFEPIPQLSTLIIGILIGVVTYIVCLFGLWKLSGSPKGIEEIIVVEKLPQLVKGVLERSASSK